MKDKELFIIEVQDDKYLTKEEIINYFKNNDTEKICLSNLRLVFNEVLTTFKDSNYDKKELISVGMLGLVKAINTFNIDYNYAFTTYAKKCIDNEIINFLNKEYKKLGNNISIEEKVNKHDEDDMLLKDCIESDTDIIKDYTNKELYKRIHDLVYGMQGIDKDVLILYFGFEDKRLTQKQIASIYNITQSRVSFIISKNLDKIKKKLEKEKYIDYKTKNKRIRKKCK